MVTIKSHENIAVMRKAGAILKAVLELLTESVKEGMSTKDIDKIAYDFIIKSGGVPSFLNYNGFPATLCTSIDEEVIHGIPKDTRILKEGQLLKIDCGVYFEGFHTDAARTVPVGRVSPEKYKLMTVTRDCFFEGIKHLKDGARLGDLGQAVQETAERNGYGVVRDCMGHGIGRELHEKPDVWNFGKMGRGERVFAGYALAVEPMINLGTHMIRMKDDNWTIVTADGKPSAHYENTVIVTENGVEILTE